MREFKSLRPEQLPDGFDAEIHGEEPIVKIEHLKERIVISYTFPGVYFSDDNRDVEGKDIAFTQLNIKAVGFLAESGKSLLPSFGRYVQIPHDCDYEVSVEKASATQFDDVLVLPAQEKLTDNPDEKHVFEYDKKFYAKDALYPEELVEVTGPSTIDDYCALLVHVRPFQYNPAKKKLIGYGSITVTIDLIPKTETDEEEAIPPGDPENHREAFGNLFLNPSRNVLEELKITPKKLYPYPLFWGPEYLIIYHSKFKKAADVLAKWKNMRGLQTETVSIDTVGNSVPQIKQYIRDRRRNRLLRWPRLRYVLLFGDVDMIVPETIPGGPWGSNITDYYYSTATDPAPGSTDCILPWLAIGRIPVRTAAEGMNVVNQIISYEKTPPWTPDYYDRMAFAAFFQDDNGNGKADRAYMLTMESIRDHMLSKGFDVQRIYVSNNPNPQFYIDGTPVPADVVASIVPSATATTMLVDATTEGQLIIGHRDHGVDLGVGWHEPPFQKAHLDLISTEIPTIFYSLNCTTGWFDLTAPQECFAEKLLRMNGAAPSLIAPTRWSHTWLNNDLMKALFDATWGGVLQTFGPGTASYSVKRNRLGDILNYGKTYLPTTTSGDTESIKDHFEIYHVLGDPTMELWTKEPLRIKIQAWVKQQFLYISLSPCPRDSVLTIWLGEKLIRRLTPASTHIKVALRGVVPFPTRPPFLPIKLLVCFWAPGYRFTQIQPRIRL